MMESQYQDPDASTLKAINDLYIEMYTLKNPCIIGIISLKDKLESITRYKYPSRFNVPFGAPKSMLNNLDLIKGFIICNLKIVR